jgi:hypothetical protein
MSSKYYSDAQKKSIMRWRELNKEEYNEYMSGYLKKFYEKNSDVVKMKRMKLYYYQKECRRMCNMYDAFIPD